MEDVLSSLAERWVSERFLTRGTETWTNSGKLDSAVAVSLRADSRKDKQVEKVSPWLMGIGVLVRIRVTSSDPSVTSPVTHLSCSSEPTIPSVTEVVDPSFKRTILSANALTSSSPPSSVQELCWLDCFCNSGSMLLVPVGT